MRELSVGTIERHLRLIAGKHGPAVAKMTKSVLSGVCGLAARHDALERNPVGDSGSIQTSAKKAPKALTPDEARTLLAELDADGSALALVPSTTSPSNTTLVDATLPCADEASGNRMGSFG
ncbi:MAG TPA: hypothetical protein VGP04_02185 [Pseudonocardiaceae bacterium]|nr:hypothetical protein [Pseudonocardiaceae bacterium]